MLKNNKKGEDFKILMVKYKTIIHVMDDYIIKCSNDYIRGRLSKMSHEEKQEKLLDILSTEEYELYKHWWDRLHWQKEYIEEIKKELIQNPDSEFYKELLEEYEQKFIETENKGFDYEKYIYRKHEPKTYSSKGYTEGLDSENREVKAQKKVEYTSEEKSSLESYLLGGSDKLNRTLWNDEEMEGWVKELDDNLSSSMKKHKLTKNTILYNGGHPTNLKIGDTITFNGYTSTSYDIDVASKFRDKGYWSKGCIYKFLAPKDTPCVNMNGLFSDTEFEVEHECLLNKNSKGKIVGFDGTYRVSDDYYGYIDVPIVVVQL